MEMDSTLFRGRDIFGDTQEWHRETLSPIYLLEVRGEVVGVGGA